MRKQVTNRKQPRWAITEEGCDATKMASKQPAEKKIIMKVKYCMALKWG